MDNLIGKKLDGRYEILQLIGVGGMANVYKARDVIDERLVAVKILREEYASNEEFVRRFKNESKAIAALNHPNIVKVYDVSFSDKMQSIVMEYIDGITLKDYIDQQKIIRWKEAVHFTVQILRALQHAHDKGDRAPGYQAAKYYAFAGRHHQGDGFRHRPFCTQPDGDHYGQSNRFGALYQP